MKKTIAIAAILATAASASALIGPGGPGNPKPKPVKPACLSVYKDKEGYQLGRCDETQRNEKYGAEIKGNGCAENQAAIKLVSVKIPMCPTYVQL